MSAGAGAGAGGHRGSHHPHARARPTPFHHLCPAAQDERLRIYAVQAEIARERARVARRKWGKRLLALAVVVWFLWWVHSK
jgi:hypothetical protein